MRTRKPPIIQNKPLQDYIYSGLYLIPSKPEGQPVIKWQDGARLDNGIITIPRLQSWWDKGIRRFQFVPADIDLLVIDLDNKNSKTGGRQFAEWYPDITPRVFVETPSNGKHIYFRVTGEIKQELQSYTKQSGDMGYGVEIIYNNHLCTAGGSSKPAGEYVLHGRLLDAPDISNYPALIEDIKAIFKPATVMHNARQFPRQSRTSKQRTFDQMADTLHKQGITIFESRNIFCFQFAKYAHKQEHTAFDTIGYLQGWLESEDFPLAEIQATVNSAYKGG